MKTTLSFLLIGALAFVFASCDKEAPTGVVSMNDYASPLAKAQGKQVPFKARVTFAIVDELLPDEASEARCGESVSIYVWQCAGYSTHLGKFDGSFSNCNFGNAYKNGEGYYTAANGDKLYFVYATDDEPTPLLPTDDEYIFTFKHSWEFTGGTGRFEGATGGGWTSGYIDLEALTGEYVNDGTISTVGSGKGE